MCVANQCVFCVQDSDCAISKHPRDLFDKLLGRNPNNMLCDKRGGGVCVDCNTNRECPTNNFCVREQPDYTKCVYRVPTCFPADATVRTLHGSKRMDEVRVGDQVLVGGGLFSTVYMFVKRDPSKALSDFVRVDLANGGAVELTDSHLLRLGSGAYLAAGRALPGMVVQVATEESSSPELHTVTRTSIVRRAGLFAPMTLHGDIVVGGIVASSYSQVAASVLPAWIAAKDDSIAAWFAHALLSPVRALHSLHSEVVICLVSSVRLDDSKMFRPLRLTGGGGLLAWLEAGTQCAATVEDPLGPRMLAVHAIAWPAFFAWCATALAINGGYAVAEAAGVVGSGVCAVPSLAH
ncbi:hint module-domain-containing protein [Pavlovales sp. CCMP2436]|nr:hint module-domain-containing protein [Pavlovales sp. CCMP2436]